MRVAIGHLKIFDDLAFIPDVIAGGHDIDAEIEEFFGERGSDSEASGGVFAVSDDEIDGVLAPEFGQAIFYDRSSGTAENVTDKKNFQGSMVSR
jgi:hypothetical protein